MCKPIHLSFTHNRAEYICALRRYFLKYNYGLYVRIDAALAFIFIVIGSYLAYSQGFGAISLIFLIPASILLLILAYAYFMLPKLIYASEPNLHHKYDLDFSDSGIAFRTKGIYSSLEWSIYKEWIVDKEFYILFYGLKRLTIIPRRAFLNSEDDNLFRELLLRHIGNPV
jgi:hypothetical protein